MRKAPYTRVELTPQERKLWQDTLAVLSWIGPGFIHIAYTLMHKNNHPDLALFTDDIQYTAATDGYQYIFKPKKFFAYSLMERVFIFLHETFHEILNHVAMGYHYKKSGVITLNGKTLPFSPMLANIVQDLVINATLIACKLGKFNPDWLWDTNIATDNDSWIEVYFKQAKAVPPTDGGRFDDHLEPHESEGTEPEDVPERSEAQWSIVIKQAMEIQAAQTDMPQPLKLFFEELLRPKVDWTQHIRGLIVRIMGSGAYNFRRLDRRLIVRGIGAPAMTGYGAGLIIVGGDSSGSIFGDRDLPKRFISEVGGMVEDANPEETRVVWCDQSVRRVDICADPQDVRKMLFDGVPGGGGTDFRPVFDYIEEHGLQPDVMIYLTDGDGTFPATAPDFPVIWGDISHDASKYPWGTVVDIPTES